jgi:methylphosphotriester-DNA--protein-cysteine methyltransferase
MGSESEPLCLDELPDRLSSPSRTKLSAVAIMWLPPENAEPNQTKDTMEQCGELNSQFSSHFKRIVGVTPRRFSISARKAQKSASPGKKSDDACCKMTLTLAGSMV